MSHYILGKSAIFFRKPGSFKEIAQKVSKSTQQCKVYYKQRLQQKELIYIAVRDNTANEIIDWEEVAKQVGLTSKQCEMKWIQFKNDEAELIANLKQAVTTYTNNNVTNW